MSEGKFYRIKDLETIKQMEYPNVLTKKVLRVDLSSQELKDISFLKNFPEIRVLILDDNEIEDLSVLQYLPKIRTLSLTDNLIRNLDQLVHLINLEWLSITDNLVHSLEPLEWLDKLDTLYADYNEITSLLPVKYMLKLELLSINKNGRIYDCSHLDHHPTLRVLKIRGNALKNTDAFFSIPNLKTCIS